jgi:hypothetical protein
MSEPPKDRRDRLSSAVIAFEDERERQGGFATPAERIDTL